MNNMTIRSEHRHDISWPVIASSLWLRAAFVGAALAAYGLASVIAGELTLAPALGLVAAGGALATFALRRSRQVLDAAETNTVPAAKQPAVPRTTLQTSRA